MQTESLRPAGGRQRTCRPPTATFRVHRLRELTSTAETHVALVKGEIDAEDAVLVRVHSECLTGDVFGSMPLRLRRPAPQRPWQMIDEEGRGRHPLHLQPGGPGHRTCRTRSRPTRMQDQGADTVEANTRLGFKPDLRDYGIGAQILVDLGVKQIRLHHEQPAEVRRPSSGYGLDDRRARSPSRSSPTRSNAEIPADEEGEDGAYPGKV
ncbi:MAG: hypothetical protein MZW92_72545 [Comamonadaceae bacterium]|nr:hypothetical protein [Comamonadaceae bacterium]